MELVMKLSGLVVYDGGWDEYNPDCFDISSRRVNMLVMLASQTVDYYLVNCQTFGEIIHFVNAKKTVDTTRVTVDMMPTTLNYPGAKCYKCIARSGRSYDLREVLPIALCSCLRDESDDM